MTQAASSSTTSRPANDYIPEFRPETGPGSIKIVAPGGIGGWVDPEPGCLADDSLPGLLAALQDLGYYPAAFEYWPFYGGSAWFSDMVPWLAMTNAYMVTFYVNAGLFAHYWNKGIHPFVGSSEEIALRADIEYRFSQAALGYPVV